MVDIGPDLLQSYKKA